MKVRKIAKRIPPVRPGFVRIKRFRSARQVAKYFGATREETRNAWIFFTNSMACKTQSATSKTRSNREYARWTTQRKT